MLVIDRADDQALHRSARKRAKYDEKPAAKQYIMEQLHSSQFFLIICSLMFSVIVYEIHTTKIKKARIIYLEFQTQQMFIPRLRHEVVFPGFFFKGVRFRYV